MTETSAPQQHSRPWLPAVAIAVVAAALALLGLFAGQSLPERNGPPVEELAVEHTVLEPGHIELTLRNTGPDPVSIGQIFVNDAYVDFSGADEPIGRLQSTHVDITYPWVDGQPYLVSMLTSTGLVIEHEIAAAVETPTPGADFFGLMVLLGTYVGIVPVLLGMLLLPVLRRSSSRVVHLLLAFTVGLLAFLAIDGTLEGIELAGAGGAFGGVELVVLGAAGAFLLLTAVDRFLRSRRETSPLRLATMIAIGIGLHNLGEGLAIGSAYAVGELALGAFLVIGFALHNTTEGIAIVAPLAQQRARLLTLLGLGVLAGAPAIVGAVVGAGVNNAELSALLLGIGVGAIVQVIVQILPSMAAADGKAGRIDGPTILGIVAGIAVMYVTGLLVTA